MNKKSVIKTKKSLVRIELAIHHDNLDSFFQVIKGIILDKGYHETSVSGPSWAVGTIAKDLNDYSTSIFYVEDKYLERINQWVADN